MTHERYQRGIERAAGEAPVPDAKQIVQSTPAPIPPRRKERGWDYTPIGLDVHRELSRDEFRNGLLPEIRAINTAQQLIVGDAYLRGIEDGHIADYADMAELSGYTEGSVKVYASLCRSIPRLMRINSLTYSHYQQIAPLPEDERPHWISYAASNGLSYRDVQRLIQWTGEHPQLPAETGAQDGAPSDDPPALPDENEEQEAVSLPSPLTDKSHRLRFNHVWKKVIRDEVDQEDVGDLTLIRNWCTMAIQRANRQLQARRKG